MKYHGIVIFVLFIILIDKGEFKLANWYIFTCDSVDVNQNGRLIVNGHYIFPKVVISQPNYGWETTLVIWVEPENEEENEELKNKELNVIIKNIVEDSTKSYQMTFKRSLPDCNGPKINCTNFYGKEKAIRLNVGKVIIQVYLDESIIKTIEYDVPLGEAPEFKGTQQDITSRMMGNELGTIDIADLVSRATKSITFVDPYLGPEDLRNFLGRIEDNNIEIKVLTDKKEREFLSEIVNLKGIYPNLSVRISNKIHDRFVLVNEDVYAFGYSLKDLRKRKIVPTY